MRRAECMRVISGLLLLTTSCASVPAESVELSKLVGEMIQSAKVSHVNMVNQHFSYRRQEVELFAYDEYKNAFLENLRGLLKQKDANFVELSLEQYDKAMSRVRKKADSWLLEVESTRAAVLQALEEHYAVLLSSQEEVTSLLRSAADVSETRASLLSRWGPKVGLSETKMREVEDKIAAGVSSLNDNMNSAVAKFGGGS